MRRCAGRMTATLVLPQDIHNDLVIAAENPLETAGVMLASVVRSGTGDVRLLARRLRWIDESAYLRRDWNGLSIASHGYVPALAQAEALHATPIWLHTHPGRDAFPYRAFMTGRLTARSLTCSGCDPTVPTMAPSWFRPAWAA